MKTSTMIGLGVVMAGALGAKMAFFPCGACETNSQALASQAASQPVVQTVALATAPYSVDNVHSSVLFSVVHNKVSNFYGRFNTVSGSFLLHDDEPSKSVMDITVQADSIDSANGKRDEHLKNSDFFSTKEFPTLTFKGTKFEKGEGNNWTVTGDLTVRGVTKQVVANVQNTGTGEGRGGSKVAGFEAKVTIMRSEFGINYGVPGISDATNLIVSLQGAQK
jgi:polyisoprenoid-binding protein YceI